MISVVVNVIVFVIVSLAVIGVYDESFLKSLSKDIHSPRLFSFCLSAGYVKGASG